MDNSRYDYDEIAEQIFFPIYEVIADDIIAATGITQGKVIDIGCGGGHLGLTLLKKTDLQGIFCDINPQALAIAEKRAAEWDLAQRSTICRQDVHHMTFADGVADLIVSRGSIGFWEDQRKAFAEIYRVLAPGGKTYIGVGLGNKELQKPIREAMRKRDPGWPKNLEENSKALRTEEYKNLFDGLGWAYRIVDDDEHGRWFILEKH